ncbi:MAG: 3-ketoacyl-ACP reductase, partial [Lewinella sp.]
MAAHHTAFVTGGSRGIGLGIVRALIGQGYEVALNGVRAEADVRDLLAELRELSERDVHYVQGNIGDTEDRERIVEAVYDTVGRLNVLVNNAGVAPRERSDLLDMTEHSYDRVMDINLKGPFFLTQAIARRMVRDRESDSSFSAYIINIGSISATVTSVNRGQYCTSKAGMGMMTQLFAARLAAEGIPVYELRPGIIQTDMTSAVTEKYDKLI